jgi:hypothetical protein
MWLSEIQAVNRMLMKFGCDPRKGRALEVGGGPIVVVDNVPQPNPLLRISPQVEFLDMGFISQYGKPPHHTADFLNIEQIARFARCYDIVYSSQTLEHVANPFIFARHMSYVARAGGFIFLSTVFSFPYHPSPHDNWRFSPSGLRLLFEEIDNVRVIYSGWGSEEGGVMLFAQKEPSTARQYSTLSLEEFLTSA